MRIGERPASGSALAFAMLLFMGLESAYWASTEACDSRPFAVYARSLLPLFLTAAVAAALLALVPRVSAVHGLGLILVGFGGGAALIVVLALLALRTRD